MKVFCCRITDPEGLHCRPALRLCWETLNYESRVTLTCWGKTADARRPWQVMGLFARAGDAVTVAIEGTNEETEAMRLQHWILERIGAII